MVPEPDQLDTLPLDDMAHHPSRYPSAPGGIDCLVAAARPDRGAGDADEVLEVPLRERPTLVTQNVVEFEIPCRRRPAEAQPVPRFVYTSGGRFPRGRVIADRLGAAVKNVAVRYVARGHPVHDQQFCIRQQASPPGTAADPI